MGGMGKRCCPQRGMVRMGIFGHWHSGLGESTFQPLLTVQIAMLVLVVLEHHRSHRHSQLPALYLLVNALLIGSRIRTLHLISVTRPAVPLYVNLASNIALLLALQFSSRSSLIHGWALPPAATAGLFSRYFIT
jgi:hypothetical protein